MLQWTDYPYWYINVDCESYTDFPLLEVVNIDLVKDPAVEALNLTTLRVPQSPSVLGSFDITYNSSTVSIQHDFEYDEFKAAIESLPGIGSVGLTQNGEKHKGHSWTITFTNREGSVDLLGVDYSQLTGANVNVTVTKVIDGDIHGIFLDPIPPEYLQVRAFG